MVAIHWNTAGAVDNYASKTWGLMTIPLITLAFAGLLKALPYLEPRRKHFEKSPKLIAATWIGVLLVIWVAEITVVGTALRWAVNILFLLKIAIGAMMMLIGNYAAKSQSMFMVGFRTPLDAVVRDRVAKDLPAVRQAIPDRRPDFNPSALERLFA